MGKGQRRERDNKEFLYILILRLIFFARIFMIWEEIFKKTMWMNKLFII